MAVLNIRADGDRFALAVGERDMLVVYGPDGKKAASLPAPSISQPVTIGATTFQVSYGRDANDLLTAILAPNPTQPQDLHFDVLNKNVDADKQAVVTVTFSHDLGHVTIDPGYIGVVEVNSQKVRHHDLADSFVPAQVAPSPEPVASALPSASGNAVAGSPDRSPMPSDGGKPLYWSEPVTDAEGHAPQVGSDEMMVVELHGRANVVINGARQRATEGLKIPSGTTVETVDGSSVAVFMGGVNSVRLLPETVARITQVMKGSVRKTRIDVEKGTVFSRVGRRSGETQDYEVAANDGSVTRARGTEFADYIEGGHHYVFVAKGTVDFDGNGHHQTLSGTQGFVGMGATPPTPNMAAILQHVLEELQQFNTKIQALADKVGNGTATPQEQEYFNTVPHTDNSNPQFASNGNGNGGTNNNPDNGNPNNPNNPTTDNPSPPKTDHPPATTVPDPTDSSTVSLISSQSTSDTTVPDARRADNQDVVVVQPVPDVTPF